MLKKAVAFLSILASIQTLGQAAPVKDYTSLLFQQSITLANGRFSGGTLTAADLEKLAGKIDSYVAKASKDGTLAAAEAVILKHRALIEGAAVPKELGSTAYLGLHKSGWLGSEEDAQAMTAAADQAERQKAIAEIQSIHLDGYLKNRANDLRTLASEMSRVNGKPRLLNASYSLLRLSLDYCTVLNGGFLAITAIGAVAALGGVDPLGDLLTAVGAVGAFATYLYCSV